MFTINVDHVAANIAADLCVRYPQVACERIEAMVASARERIEPTNTHPEFPCAGGNRRTLGACPRDR